MFAFGTEGWLYWMAGSAAVGGIMSAYFSGYLLEHLTTRQVRWG
jgi:hypothetical protein